MDETQLRAWSHTTELEARFWSKVTIVDDDDSCWEWKRGRHPDGYGMFQLKIPGESKSRAHVASRVVLYLANGVMPEVARHTCDNPPCCRPGHLLDGTHADNAEDRTSRGRNHVNEQWGETNPNAILTDAIVLEARRRARTGERHEALAVVFGVQRPTLSLAIRGETWARLNTIEEPVLSGSRRDNQRGEANSGSVLTDDMVIQARRRSRSGETQQSIADDLGVSRYVLSYAISGKTWSHLNAVEAPHVRSRGGGTRLVEEDIRTIRKLAVEGTPQKVLAATYGLTPANVSHIVRRKSWRHVTS